LCDKRKKVLVHKSVGSSKRILHPMLLSYEQLVFQRFQLKKLAI
jgi:hypothetical protein